MSLDVVIPAHNEQHRIDRTLSAYRAGCRSADTRFLVALDDCTDDTAAIVERHRDADPRVQRMEFPRLGKGGVVMEAFRRTSADVVAFVDADSATPPAELLRLVELVEQGQADLAIASRWHPSSVLPRRRPLPRRMASAGFAAAVRGVTGLPYRDTQCGAKVLSRAVADRLVPLVSSRDFLFDVDLLLVARELELTVAEVPTVWVDRDGSRLRIKHDARRMALSLARLWLHHRVIPVRTPAAAVVPYPEEPVLLPAPLPAPPSRSGLTAAERP